MDINWRDDVLVIAWVSQRGIEFDVNPNIYPKMLKAGEHKQLGLAMREFGSAMIAGQIEASWKPRIYGPDGRQVN